MLKLFSSFTGGWAVYLLIAGVVAAPTAFVAHNNGYASATKEHVKYLDDQRDAWFLNTAMLWRQLGQSNQSQYMLIEQFEDVMSSTEEAKEEFRKTLVAYRSETKEAKFIAAAALKRLDLVEDSWKDDTVPDAVICVRKRPGCTDSPIIATGGENVLGFRGGTTRDGEDLPRTGDGSTEDLSATVDKD